MDVKGRLVELLQEFIEVEVCDNGEFIEKDIDFDKIAENLIANDVTVQEWIPVSSPPKKPGEYLCYFKYEPESPNIICQNTYYGSGRWMSEPDKVTHWACLPRPPKGE